MSTEFRRGVEHMGTFRPSNEGLILNALKEARRPMTYSELYSVTGVNDVRIRQAHLSLILTGEVEGEAQRPPFTIRLSAHRECSACGEYVAHDQADYVCLRCRDSAVEGQRGR